MSLFSKKSPLKNSNFAKKRSLRVESLEERQMLAIDSSLCSVAFNQAVFDQLDNDYTYLDFGGDYDTYAAETSNRDALVVDASSLKAMPINGTGGINDTINTRYLNLIVIRVDGGESMDLDAVLNMNNLGKDFTIIVWNSGEADEFGEYLGGAGTFQINQPMAQRHLSIQNNSPSTRINFGGIEFTHLDPRGTPMTTEGGGITINGGNLTQTAILNLDSVSFVGCVAPVNGNVNATAGGAINMQNGANVTVNRGEFINNTAGNGGAVYQVGGTFAAYNSLFARNSATFRVDDVVYGGAVYATGNGAVTEIVNSTVANNSTVAGIRSAAVSLQHNGSQGRMMVGNTIFADNGGKDLDMSGNGTRTISNTIRSDGTSGTINTGSFNIVSPTSANNIGFNEAADPKFVDAAANDYTLQFGSPAIDRINNYANLPVPFRAFDLAGNPRVMTDVIMDVGAYEYQTSAKFFAADDIINLGNYTPVFDGTNYTFVFDANVILANDTPSGYQNITFADPRFEQSSDGKTVTFTWDMRFNVEEVIANAYKLGTTGDWSNEATITLIYPNEKLYSIVTTCEDLDGPIGSDLNEYDDRILSLRQAIHWSNTDLAAYENTIIFAPYLARDYDHTGVNIVTPTAYGGLITLDTPDWRPMDITSNVKIVGLGADLLTIDADGKSRIFDIANFTRDPVTFEVTRPDVQLHVEISGMTLANGKALGTEFGGDVGGAIYVSYVSLKLDSVDIVDCFAARGGAIYSSYGDLEITNSNFARNEATTAGGAIWRRGSDWSTLVDWSTSLDSFTLTGSTFEDNKVLGNKHGGGAIYFSDTTNEIATIADSIFEGNEAESGGAIFSSTGTFVITDSTFHSNKSLKDGGAVFASNSVLSIGGVSVLSGNIATQYGGAIYVSNTTLNIGGESVLLGNGLETTRHGGAIYASNSTLNIGGQSVLSGNIATQYGGAIYASNSVVSVTGVSLLSGNHAERGGAIYADNTELNIADKTTWSVNRAARGGAIFSMNGACAIDGAVFQANESTDTGGAIWRRGSDANSFFTLTDVTFEGNKYLGTKHGGGAIYFSDSTNETVTIVGSIFERNEAIYGGALYSSTGAFVITGSTFNLNNASKDGGAIFASNSDLSINESSVLSGNQATRYGGAIFAPDSVVSVTESLLSGNFAQRGGAIYATNTDLTIGTSIFSDNGVNVADRGGAIYSLYGSLNISSTNFEGNTASRAGGAIWRRGESGVSTFSDVYFAGNCALLASSEGGAIYLSDSSAEKVLISHTLFTETNYSGNLAKDGAALFVGNGEVELTNGLFESNLVTRRGEVFYKLAPAKVTLKIVDGLDLLGEKVFGTGNSDFWNEDDYSDWVSQL